MNRPSRTDEPQPGDGYNQSPPELSNDLTTNQDLNGISNTRALLREDHSTATASGKPGSDPPDITPPDGLSNVGGVVAVGTESSANGVVAEVLHAGNPGPGPKGPDEQHEQPGVGGGGDHPDGTLPQRSWLARAKDAIFTFGKFVGPGFMVAVAYSRQISQPEDEPGQ